MKSTGILRKVDEMGRFVLPKEIRTQLNIRENTDYIEILVKDGDIVLRKYESSCSFCGKKGKLKKYKNLNICENCAKDLKKIL